MHPLTYVVDPKPEVLICYRAPDYNHFDQMTSRNIGFISCNHLTSQVMISPDITKLLRSTILRTGQVTQQTVGLFKHDVT